MKIFKAFLNALSSLDFVSYKPQVLYRGKENFQSAIGGIFSLLTVGFLIGFGLFFFVRLFERATYSLASNESIDSYPIYNRTGIPFIFKLVDGNGANVKNDSSVFHFEGLLSSNRAFTYYLSPCALNNSLNFGDYASYFKYVWNIESYNCLYNISNYNFSLFGLYENNQRPKAFINIIVKTCKNKTNSTICQPKETIDKILSSVYIQYLYLEHHIDHNNIDYPGNLILQTLILSLSSSIYKRYNLFHSIVEYKTDYGYLFPDPKTENYFLLTSQDVSVDLRTQTGSDKFGQVAMFLSQKRIAYSRTYAKLQDVIASVGGIISVVLFMSALLLKHVTKRLYLIQLANENFVSKAKDWKRQSTAGVLTEKAKDNAFLAGESAKLFGATNIEMSTEKKETMNYPTEIKDIEINMQQSKSPRVLQAKGDNLHMDEIKSDVETVLPRKTPLKDVIHTHKLDFEDCLDEKGKIKKSFRNVFFPREGIKKVYELIEKKSGQDALLNYESQTEKIKKFVFASEEELDIFNHLPDLDFEDVFRGTAHDQKHEILAKNITKLQESQSNSKMINFVKKF